MNSILKIGEANKGIITATEVTNHGIPRRVFLMHGKMNGY
jgi:hypothetical protein